MKIIKNILPYWKTVIVIIVLLAIQATCSLSLPQYTSDIIDTGIQNRGVEHILPKKISHIEYNYTLLFMNEAEEETFKSVYEKADDCYNLIVTDKDKLDVLDEQLIAPLMTNCSLSFVDEEKTENITDGFLSENILSGLNLDKFSVTREIKQEDGKTVKVKGYDLRPLFSLLSQGVVLENGQVAVLPKQSILSFRKAIEKQIDTMGYDMIKSTAISYAIQCNEECGVDISEIQSNYLWLTGFKMLLVAVILTLASISVGFFSSRVGASIGRNLRSQIFAKVVSFSNKEIDEFSTASLITRSTNDIQQIQMVTTMLLRMALFAPLMSIGSIIKVMNTASQMTWVIGLAVAIIAIAVVIMFSIAMPKFKLMQKLVDNVNLIAREILTGIPVIRAFRREDKEESRFDRANTSLTKTTLFTNRVMTFMSPIMMFVMSGTSVLIVWIATGHIVDGTMQVGEMVAFINYATHIVISFLVLTFMSITIPRAAVASERIDEVINTNSSITDAKKPLSPEIKKGVVEFNDVSFMYPNADENTLKNISFTANSGETTAIIGSTGSGKSTLINLIPRLYEVTQGSVTIDGYDVRDLSMKHLRDLIGYVPQKGILFSGTIKSNIKFGNKNATDDLMRKSAEIAQAKDFIEEKPMQYDNEIAQGGTNVSGGQKQRLSIARAIAKNPKIYIFDDSFSALDMKTDAILRSTLSEYVGDSTVIIVAQRISTIINADKIIVLDDGEIVGQGTHNELLNTCDTYLEIAKSQLSPSELENNQEVSNDE